MCVSVAYIVQRADLESRQSLLGVWKHVRRLCKERIWNQGKAMNMRIIRCPDCAKSGFGIKAKQSKHSNTRRRHCAKSGFGIKAKHQQERPALVRDCAKSGFGIKAKPHTDAGAQGRYCAKSGFGIKAKLESKARTIGVIVQRADLESRQSTNTLSVLDRQLCKERIWNQGKANHAALRCSQYCAKSGFGIKAKPKKLGKPSREIVQRADLESRQSHGPRSNSLSIIVQRADLESRQSRDPKVFNSYKIVQRADLESRQSRRVNANIPD